LGVVGERRGGELNWSDGGWRWKRFFTAGGGGLWIPSPPFVGPAVLAASSVGSWTVFPLYLFQLFFYLFCLSIWEHFLPKEKKNETMFD
jgi:hypothetical protein